MNPITGHETNKRVYVNCKCGRRTWSKKGVCGYCRSPKRRTPVSKYIDARQTIIDLRKKYEIDGNEFNAYLLRKLSRIMDSDDYRPEQKKKIIEFEIERQACEARARLLRIVVDIMDQSKTLGEISKLHNTDLVRLEMIASGHLHTDVTGGALRNLRGRRSEWKHS